MYAGVQHLNSKRKSGLLLFKNQQAKVDYYTTVQTNSKFVSSQSSTLPTSRGAQSKAEPKRNVPHTSI